MAGEEDVEIPASGAVFTFGRSRFADNVPSHFFIRNDPVIDLDCGDEHTAVVCQNGRVFMFGNNEWGQLGLGHQSVVNKPSCVKSLKPEHATHLACGRAHTLISTGSGKVYSCGSNSDGQLGLGDTVHRDTPAEIDGIAGTVEQLAAGCHHSVALNNKGQVYVWGSNADGQLGLGEDVKAVSVPTILHLEESIASIACGYYHTVFLTEEGQALVCGEGDGGKLGLGSTANVMVPTLVPLEAFLLFITAGGNHTIAIAVDGKVYGWGSNSNGQLGLTENSETEITVPTVINSLSGRVIKEAACGESHTGFITENGELLTCGETRHGKLGCEASGTRDTHYNVTPIKVPRFKGFSVTKVKCGGCHTIVLASPRTNEIDEQLIVVSNGHAVSPTKSLRPPETGIISPPPVSARGPLPPLQRVPLPVPTKNKTDSISKSYPESLSSLNQSIKINIDNPLNDPETLSGSSSVQSNQLQDESDDKKSFKDFEVTSLNGSVTIVDSPQYSANKVSTPSEGNQCLSAISGKNREVEFVKSLSDGDDVVGTINCHEWLQPLDYQITCELKTNFNNSSLKLWLEEIDDNCYSSSSVKENKYTGNQINSAQNFRNSDEDFINETFTLKPNCDDADSVNSSSSFIIKSEKYVYSKRKETFNSNSKQDITINEHILLNNKDMKNLLKEENLSLHNTSYVNLSEQNNGSIRSLPNCYKYSLPDEIARKKYLRSHSKNSREIDEDSEIEYDPTTEEEYIMNVINEKYSQMSSERLSNRSNNIQMSYSNSYEECMVQDDRTRKRFKISENTTRNADKEVGVIRTGREITDNLNNFSCNRFGQKVQPNCLNKTKNMCESVDTILKYFKKGESSRTEIDIENVNDSNNKFCDKYKKSVPTVKSDFVLNNKSINKLTENNSRYISNEYLMMKNKNFKQKNGIISNILYSNNSHRNEYAKRENQTYSDNQKNYVKRNVSTDERLRGGEDKGYIEVKGVWRRIDAENNFRNSESELAQLVIKHSELCNSEEERKELPVEVALQPANKSLDVEVMDATNQTKVEVTSGGLIRKFLNRMKRTPAILSEAERNAANISEHLEKEVKSVKVISKTKTKVKSKMCTIL